MNWPDGHVDAHCHGGSRLERAQPALCHRAQAGALLFLPVVFNRSDYARVADARRFAQYFRIRSDTALRWAAVHFARRRRCLTGSAEAEVVRAGRAALAVPFKIAISADRSCLISVSLTLAPIFVRWLSWSRDNSDGTLCSPFRDHATSDAA